MNEWPREVSAAAGYDPVEVAARELAIYHFALEDSGGEDSREVLHHEQEKDSLGETLSYEQRDKALELASEIIIRRQAEVMRRRNNG